MIRLDNVSKTFTIEGGVPVYAVSQVSLDVCAGEFLIVTGRSGSGKTTLLNLMAGLTRPSAGKVYLDGADLWSLPDARQTNLRNRMIGFVFQFPSLLPSLTTLENVTLPVMFRGNHTDDEQVNDRAMQLLERVGLVDKRNAFPRQLSAGQQQRAVIARAMMGHPKLYLADEPTSNLDEKTEHEIMGLLSEIHATEGSTIVLVTHTTQLVPYGTRAIQMSGGQIADPEHQD